MGRTVVVIPHILMPFDVVRLHLCVCGVQSFPYTC